MLYQEGWGLEILTTSLAVQVSTIAVGVGVAAIVAIAIWGDKVLRQSTHTGQQSQEGSKQNELKNQCHFIPKWEIFLGLSTMLIFL
jgi:MFS superfamily sulfate permease-like transporter